VVSLSLLVTPSGHLRLDAEPPAPAPLEPAVAESITQAFARGEGPGLLHLGAAQVETPLPPVLGYFRDLGRTFLSRVCQLTDPDQELSGERPALDEGTLARLLLNLPPMRGAEYVDGDRVRTWWADLARALAEQASASAVGVGGFLRACSPLWNLVGRVHFHLAENKRDQARPFAFLATYATGVAERGKVQHAPLGQALRQYAGQRNKEALLSLLAPVSRAAEQLDWVKALLDAGGLYQPLAWAPSEALAFLKATETLESAGLVVRVPELWRGRRPPQASVQVTIGSKRAAGLGAEALLDFQVSVALDGQLLTATEIRELLATTDGLASLRGRWVEVDRQGLAEVLERWKDAERAHDEGLPFHEALRLLAGAAVTGASAKLLAQATAQGARVVAGPWLEAALEGLRTPEGLAAADPGDDLRAELRPYQQAGVRWLWWLRSLGLGGCLADDMGLGKTVQVIALLVLCRRQRQRGKDTSPGAPSLVVTPASLLGNWRSELARFAPQLRVLVAHTSETAAAELGQLDPERLASFDVVLTSYGTLPRLDALGAMPWDVLIADEAQALKNPGTRQARSVRALQARSRLALTGTPVENRLADLWSILAFSTPGLLGTAREFSSFVKALEARAHDSYGPLRALVRPYILRRLKTQKQIISDLPDKTEVKAFCGLSKKQTVLYQQAVEALKGQLASADGMARRGVVLASLMRLKQICNHPSQWLGDGQWEEEDSGKLQRIGALVEEIAGRQEKVLVFTQFKEATLPLAAHLARGFGRPGLVLSGETAVGKRHELVEQFQAEDGPPFFVLSLRAGGTGLTLTAASHVIHFDRWWNPAVEDQATDRAFRIGQKRNVLVHKLVCRGTLEERIDALIESKRALARQVVEGDAEVPLTELSNEEILRLVSLDLRTASAEGS
jgi:non-specific serine/threonine protein kinase